MAARRIAKDGLCRRRMISAIIRAAQERGKRVPSFAAMARVLGVTGPAVSYHVRKIREEVR